MHITYIIYIPTYANNIILYSIFSVTVPISKNLHFFKYILSTFPNSSYTFQRNPKRRRIERGLEGSSRLSRYFELRRMYRGPEILMKARAATFHAGRASLLCRACDTSPLWTS